MVAASVLVLVTGMVEARRQTGIAADYLAAAGGMAAVTAVCCLLRSRINEMTVALAMLLFILFVASKGKRDPALVASVLGMLCLNYFFLPPVYTLTIEDPKNWMALTAFFAAALIGGRLSGSIRQQSQEIEDLYNHAPCGYHSLDRDGVFIRINDTELEWLQYRREELIGKKRFTDLLTPDGRRTFKDSFPQLKAKGTVQDLEFDLIRKDGTTIPVLLSASAVRDSSGDYLRSRSTVYDITSRKLQEQAQARLAAIVEYSDDAIISEQLDGTILTWNKAAERMFEYTAAEAVGRPVSILAPPDRTAELEQRIARLRRGGATERVETVRVAKDGHRFDVAMTISPIRDPSGNPTSLAVIEHDITGRKRAEHEIRMLATRQSVTAELGLQALRSDPLGSVFDEAVAQLAKVLSVDYARVLELQPDGTTLLLRAGVGWKEGVVGHAETVAEPESQAGFTLRSQEPVVVENLAKETRFRTVPMFDDPPVVSGMSTVIATGTGPYGVLAVHTRQQRTFTEDEVTFLQSVANVLGTIIERRRADEELVRSNRAHRALSRCNEALVRAVDESTLLNQICRLIVDEAGYRFCWVGHADENDLKTVTPIAQAGEGRDYLRTVNISWADVERGRGPTGLAIRTGERQVVRVFAADPRVAPWREVAVRCGFASSMAIPLVVDGRIFGALTIYSAETEAFGTEEVELLSELAADLGFGITGLHTRAERRRAEEEIRTLNAQLEQRVHQRTAELETANRDLARAREHEIEIGSRIQQTLLHDPPPQDLPGLRAAALTVPSQRVDGDFYTFLQHPAGRLDVVIGDVMGKGVPAALLGAAARFHFLRAMADLLILSKDGLEPQPSEIVMLAHAALAPRLIELDSFVTLAYARFDERSQTLSFVDCGHTGILQVQGGTGACQVLHGDNLPLGVREAEIYRQIPVKFETGDLFVFFSDGITEARSPAGELFGVERLERWVRENRALDPRRLVEGIRETVAAFSGPGQLADDLTAIAIRAEKVELSVMRDELEIESDLRQLRRAREFVRGFCGRDPGKHLDDDRTAALELAVNEALSNIMKHAYHGVPGQWIHLEAEAFATHVTIRLLHFGDPFNPSKAPPPPLDGSRESGFGAWIIARSVDEVKYDRDERGRNCVTLTERRKPEAS
jgi:phosphoserine phosphatase RsbU/P